MSIFSKRMKKIRIEKGITLQELADALDTTTSTLSRYENDKAQPNLHLVSNLADYLNTTVDYLVGRTDQKYPDWYKNLPEELQEFVDRHGIEYFESVQFANQKGIPPEDIKTIIETFEELKPLIDKLGNK